MCAGRLWRVGVACGRGVWAHRALERIGAMGEEAHAQLEKALAAEREREAFALLGLATYETRSRRG